MINRCFFEKFVEITKCIEGIPVDVFAAFESWLMIIALYISLRQTNVK